MMNKSLLFILPAVVFFSCTNDKIEVPDNTGIQINQSYCDSLAVTYSNDVSAIMSDQSNGSSCVDCHNNANPSGGVKLDNYQNITATDLEQLLLVIKHQSTDVNKYMPMGQSKLADTTIAKIECWIDAGAPNN